MSGAEAGTGSGGGTGSRSYTGTGRVFSALDGADDGAGDVAAARLEPWENAFLRVGAGGGGGGG